MTADEFKKAIIKAQNEVRRLWREYYKLTRKN